ncbi:extracellular solute-binding protein [Nakamurella flavida]|uniref:Extracellular solute-binding protein n=1 Tax=Nakamurella flavida TaxID=363630 RepID=A0A938YR29_9ACTN|nr:extracellular solute-binding protein [Nakamurella flavida]MBM9477874.1 extracellular solute-binding protein [Nakamurella flavida]MDP9778412.1 ABC-type glycerol-3-phosphate transport system substrate-binding protein [Nakamurella flavida]
MIEPLISGPSGHRLSRRSLLKSASLVGAAALSTPLLGACGASDGVTSAGSTNTSAGGKTQVKIASWMQFEPGRKEAWAAVLDAFNAQSRTAEAVLVGWPFAQYANQVLTQVQAGGLDADLITAPPDLAARLFSLNQFLPATQAIDAAGVHPDEKLHSFVIKEGQFYGVSTVTVGFGLLYNEKVLEEAGLQPPTTPEEWVAQGQQLTVQPDRFGVLQANNMAEAGNFWFNLQNTVNAYDGLWAQGRTPLVTSDPVIKSLELFKTLYDSSMPKGLNDAQSMALMGDGRAAMGVLVSATVNVLKSGSPDVYPLMRSVAPPWAGKKATNRVHPISLYSGSNKQEAATEFLTWLLKPENMADLTMRSLDAIPPYPELEQVPAFQAYLKDLPWLPGYQDVTPVTPMDLMGDFITASDEFGNIVLTSFQQSLSGGVPVAESMGQAQTQLEALASRLT